MILFRPERIDTIHKGFRVKDFVIKIIAPTVSCIGICYIIPGIVGCRAIVGGIPVKLRKRGIVERMIEYHVEYYGHPSSVTVVYQCFKVVLWTIIFIGCKVKCGIISP